jgi:L-amino acid N-acyltransferase YncA
VIPEARNLGIGRQLVDACITQSREWGYDQVLLQVESDNKVARMFYKKLGFEELLTDMNEKRYDLTGFFLVMKPAPKVLLRKVIIDYKDYKSYEIEEIEASYEIEDL